MMSGRAEDVQLGHRHPYAGSVNAVDTVHFHYMHGTDNPRGGCSRHRHGLLKTRPPTPKGYREANKTAILDRDGLVRFTGLCDTLLIVTLLIGPPTNRAQYTWQKRPDAGSVYSGVAMPSCQHLPADGRGPD